MAKMFCLDSLCPLVSTEAGLKLCLLCTAYVTFFTMLAVTCIVVLRRRDFISSDELSGVSIKMRSFEARRSVLNSYSRAMLERYYQ